jgi:hypothetical protein
MSEPKRYAIRTVADFLAIPPEKVGDCLIDFCGWIVVMHSAMDLPSHVTVPESFDWIDDGEHLATVTLKNGATGEVLDRATADMADLLSGER